MAALVYTVKVPSDFLISAQDAADAASIGVTELITQHLRDKNANTPPKAGFPKSDYWADAADSVTTKVSGSAATITIKKEGVALHYEGGTVLPKRGKAIAIPLEPSLADIWPSEYGCEMFVVWPKGKSSGLLIGADLNDEDNIGRALYRLVYKAPIPADKTVLPTDEEITNAASEAIWGDMAA